MYPNKTDALNYLDNNGTAPSRYARATIQNGATIQPYIQEYMVGPLPVDNTTTQYQELNYIYNKGVGRQNVYNADADAIAEFNLEVGSSIEDITKALLNGVSFTIFLSWSCGVG